MVFSSPACVQEAEAWSNRMEGYGGPCRKGRWAPPVRMLKLTEALDHVLQVGASG